MTGEENQANARPKQSAIIEVLERDHRLPQIPQIVLPDLSRGPMSPFHTSRTL